MEKTKEEVGILDAISVVRAMQSLRKIRAIQYRYLRVVHEKVLGK